ncbi:hypothetical protein D3C87_1990430 [compost metagenome]
MIPHDLEAAPAGRLQCTGLVDQLGIGQALMFGRATDVSTGTRVNQIGLAGREFVGMDLEFSTVII